MLTDQIAAPTRMPAIMPIVRITKMLIAKFPASANERGKDTAILRRLVSTYGWVPQLICDCGEVNELN